MRWDLLNQGPSDPVREALHWSETHSSSSLSDALVAVGIKKSLEQSKIPTDGLSENRII